MTAIAILDDYQGVAPAMADWSGLPEGVNIEIFRDHLHYGPELVARLQRYEIICTMRERTPFPKRLLEQLPKLKLLLTAGMKNASIDIDSAKAMGITVCGTTSPGHATAELTWGLILAVMRKLCQEDRNTRNGQWQTSLGNDLHGKTLGVIGLGRLGAQVAAVGNAFSMNVLAWSQNLDDQRCRDCGVSLAGKDELLAQADVITLHLRLSERTRGLIAGPEFALMKPSAILVNTSRGPIVEEKSLIAALRQKQIAAAGLDVYDIEPLPVDHELLQLENTVISPHLGFVTEETYRIFYGQMLENIIAYLQGTPIRVL